MIFLFVILICISVVGSENEDMFSWLWKASLWTQDSNKNRLLSWGRQDAPNGDVYTAVHIFSRLNSFSKDVFQKTKLSSWRLDLPGFLKNSWFPWGAFTKPVSVSLDLPSNSLSVSSVFIHLPFTLQDTICLWISSHGRLCIRMLLPN